MRASSAKAKGRRASVEVKELLHLYAPDLRPDDIIVTPSGVCGEDVLLSPAARALYPFTIECKNQEKLNIWDALKQAESHLKKRTEELCVPLLFFKRNRSKLFVALDAELFLKLVR